LAVVADDEAEETASLGGVPNDALVLVVADTQEVRRHVMSFLARPGITFLQASSSKEALAEIAQHEPDVVVLDLQIDSMGGVADCMEIRLQQQEGNLAPCAILMLLDRRADVFLARRSGADGWLVKPLDPIRAREALRAMLSGDRYEDEAYKPIPVLVTPERAIERPSPHKLAREGVPLETLRKSTNPL
jgi:DNA-binding response OmpR family regulator